MSRRRFIPYAELDDDRRAMVDSDRWPTREKAASLSLGLDRLAFDESAYVRFRVASKGFGLDLLSLDESRFVTDQVSSYLCRRYGDVFTLDKWAADNPEKRLLPDQEMLLSPNHPANYHPTSLGYAPVMRTHQLATGF